MEKDNLTQKERNLRVGQRVRALRQEQGLSQDALAQKLGYTGRSAVNKIELGVRSLPVEKAEILGQIFGVSPASLIYPDAEQETARSSQPAIQADSPVFALFRTAPEEVTPEMLEEISSYAEYLKEKMRRKKMQ